MDTLNIIAYFAAATSIIALPFLVINWAKYMRAFPNGFPIKSVGFFVIPAIIAGVITSFMTTSTRDEVSNFIQGLSGDYTVYVNQQPVRDAHKIISALKGIAPYSAHHSYPTKRIHIDVHSDRGRLTLELGRDSGNRQEYWVFYPEHGVTSDNEIGRITTSVFDDY